MEDTLQTILSLGDEMEGINAQIQEHDTHIKTLKERKKQIEEQQLPDMMDELNLEELALTSGKKIKAIDFVAARVSDPEAAYRWLEETNNAGIIKNKIQINLNTGSNRITELIKEDLANRGVGYMESKNIHHSTLNSFVKEALNNPELSQTLPKKAFGVYEARKVVFK
tara:strand:- start:469 stop:972 length:504 start_codon:yes stop_codon:yes gene_type:complete